MSKPNSGLFPTGGQLNVLAEIVVTASSYEEAVKLIAQRAKDLDLREHALGYTLPSKAKINEIKTNIKNRTATKQDYMLYASYKRFEKRRKRGVDRFWKEERRRLKLGLPGTRNWTRKQREDILAGKRPKFNGKTIEAHHTYSAHKYPHLADVAAILFPASHEEHHEGWHGGDYKKSQPGKPIKDIFEF